MCITMHHLTNTPSIRVLRATLQLLRFAANWNHSTTDDVKVKLLDARLSRCGGGGVIDRFEATALSPAMDNPPSRE